MVQRKWYVTLAFCQCSSLIIRPVHCTVYGRVQFLLYVP
jgi:hypothetical protein